MWLIIFYSVFLQRFDYCHRGILTRTYTEHLIIKHSKPFLNLVSILIGLWILAQLPLAP